VEPRRTEVTEAGVPSIPFKVVAVSVVQVAEAISTLPGLGSRTAEGGEKGAVFTCCAMLVFITSVPCTSGKESLKVYPSRVVG
jgi:hypothetical protein